MHTERCVGYQAISNIFIFEEVNQHKINAYKLYIDIILLLQSISLAAVNRKLIHNIINN